jgi:MFS family permease
MVAESVDQSQIGSAYGLIQAMDSAGAIVGPLAALALIGHCGMRGVFGAAAVPGALCVLVAWFGIREAHRSGSGGIISAVTDAHSDAPAKPTSVAVGTLAESGMRLRLPGGFYYVLGVVTLFSLGNSSDMFLVLRAGSAGIPASQAPLLGLVFNVMYTLVSWPAGKFSDRFSRSTIAAAGYFVFAAVYFVFAMAPSRRALWLTMACYGLFYALTNPVLKALVVETVAAEVRGRALGIYFFVTSLTTLLASVITGELWNVYGAPVPFYLSSGIAAVSAVALLAHRAAVKGADLRR